MAKKITKDLPVAQKIPQISSELSVTPSELQTIKNSCARNNISIDDYVKAIKEGLKATKTTIDTYGEEHMEADHATRLKSALMGLELEGYIKNKQITTDNRKYTQVVYSWRND